MNVRTGDPLSHASDTPITKIGDLDPGGKPNGDGGIVVPLKGRVPGFHHSKRVTRSPLHYSPLLKLEATGYNSMPAYKRHISSKPHLSELKIYQKAYHQIKNNSGSMTPGVDKMTIDGMSNERLTKIMEKVRT